ncbi:MAG: hypothetical protein HYS12_13505 [Planctomycetes bacterium]|nr:hypothetical protein [Planctomycetota bacterium]
MREYFLAQCGSTLLALLALAAAGGWALVAFRNRERPYLWLAAPLAGIGTLSLSLTLLYDICRLRLPASFAVAMLLNVAATAAALWRGRPWQFRRREWALGLAALLGVTAAGVKVVQKTAIRQGEPTILITAGTDQFGYAQNGDWIVRHPHEEPAISPDRPYESWIAWGHSLQGGDPRRGAYLLVALAGWCRGTTTLFSYDFATGVALIAGLLGFGAAFGRRFPVLLLLLAAVAVSVWLRNARTGFFGKTLAYPGGVLLVWLLIQTWHSASVPRVLSCLVLGSGFGLCHNVLAIATFASLLCVGVVLVSLACRLLDRLGGRERPETEPAPVWKGVLLGLLVVMPLGVCTFSAVRTYFNLRQSNDVLAPDFIFAEALDVNINWEPMEVPSKLRHTLILASVGITATCLLWALACRAVVAAGLLLSGGILLAGWWSGRSWSMLQTQGILYPLTLAGVALLAQHRSVRRLLPLRLAALLLLLALAGLRGPQMIGTWREATRTNHGVPGFIAQSDIAAVLNRVQDGGVVDVCHQELCPCLALLAELGARDIPVQYRGLAWSHVVGYRRWAPRSFPNCGKYLITSWAQGAASASNSSCALWAVVRNEGAWVSQVKPPLGMGRDVPHGYHFWVGRDQTEIELSNGMAAPVEMEFVAYTEMPAAPTDPRKCTCTWEVAGQKGKLDLKLSDHEIHIPLRLPPGDHKLSLRVEQVSPLCGDEGRRLLLSRFGLRTGLGGSEGSEPR